MEGLLLDLSEEEFEYATEVPEGLSKEEEEIYWKGWDACEAGSTLEESGSYESMFLLGYSDAKRFWED